MSKKTLIEIIIAGALLVAELIWALVYGLGGFSGIAVYKFGEFVKMEYVELYISRLLVIFLNIDIIYAIVVMLINSKSEKHDRVFEIFVAVLLLVVDAVVVLYCRYSAEKWNVDMNRYLVRLLLILAQINVVYIIALLIIKSENYKLCKTIVAVVLATIEFVTVWFCLKNMTVKVDGDSLRNYKTFMTVLTVFASIWVVYAVGLRVFDFIYGKKSKNDKDVAAVASPTAD